MVKTMQAFNRNFFPGSITMFRVRTLTLTGALWAGTMGLTACTSSHSAQDPRTAPQLAELSLVQSAGVSQRAFSGVV